MRFTRLFDIPTNQQERYPQTTCLATKVKGQWRHYSTRDVIEKINQVSCGLLALDVEPGEKVAIISDNRPEWNFIDLGAQQIGAITVPIYYNISRENYVYIFNQTAVRYIFVENKDIYDKVQSVRERAGSIRKIFIFEEVEGAPHWTEILANGDMAEVEARKTQVQEDDLATIIYTSGTTGLPKGVMLSHKNIASNVRAALKLLPVSEGHRALSFLPMNHSFERMLVYLYLASGVSVYYAESIDALGDNLREVKPHIFATVPRLLEKVYERIVSRGEAQPGLKKKIFFWSLDLANAYELNGKDAWYNAQLAVADRLVFSKWREALGGNVLAVISGGAALNPKLARIFTAAGIPVMEGYGLTETSPVLAVNRYELNGRRFGTVGLPVEKVEIKIAEDGEILAQGPNIMQGYFQMPEKTADVIDDDGWFHTGDIGVIDDAGFLRITDRKKSMFKTSGGKYVAPQPIENSLKESPLVENVMVIGEGRKMVTALIAPNFENLKEWCQTEGISWTAQDEIINNGAVRQKFEQIVKEKCEPFDHTEQVKRFELIPHEWSVETGELTPTLKTKRPVIQDKYSDKIERMYS